MSFHCQSANFKGHFCELNSSLTNIDTALGGEQISIPSSSYQNCTDNGTIAYKIGNLVIISLDITTGTQQGGVGGLKIITGLPTAKALFWSTAHDRNITKISSLNIGSSSNPNSLQIFYNAQNTRYIGQIIYVKE